MSDKPDLTQEEFERWKAERALDSVRSPYAPALEALIERQERLAEMIVASHEMLLAAAGYAPRAKTEVPMLRQIWQPEEDAEGSREIDAEYEARFERGLAQARARRAPGSRQARVRSEDEDAG